MGVVVITGCSSGFGLETAVAFAESGETVYATMRNIDKAGPLRAAADAAGVEIEVRALDVSDDASVRGAIDGVLEAGGRIDVLVNNAGIGGNTGPIELLPDEEWLNVLGTNLLGAVRAARAVLPAMRAQGEGTIVNVSSVQGRTPGTPVTAPYATSKHALCALSDSLLAEIEQFGLRVACVEPGFFATSVYDNASVRPVDEGSPYAELVETMDRFYAASVPAGADPRIVSDRIVELVAKPDPDTIHHPVGADAEMMVAGVATMTYNEYRAITRQLVGLA